MKKLPFILVILINASAFAQTDEEKIRRLVLQLDQAIVAKDSVLMGTILMSQFAGTIPTGLSFGKNDYIRFHCKPGVGVTEVRLIEDRPFSVVIYGNTAVVTRAVATKRKAPAGEPAGLVIQRMEVCVKENGKWLIAAGQGTLILGK